MSISLYKSIALALFFGLPLLLQASTETALPDTSDSKKPKVKSVKKEDVFDPDDYFEKPKPQVNYKSIIKFNPVLVLFGDIPFYYEQKINSSLGLEIGAGLTTVNYTSISRVLDQSDPNYELSSGVGYSARASLRYYFGSSAAVLGWYVAPEVQYKLFNATVAVEDASQPDYPTITLAYPRSFVDGRITMGVQEDINGRITYDYYWSFGLRYKTNSSIENIYSTERSPSVLTTNAMVPVIGFGIKFGFAL